MTKRLHCLYGAPRVQLIFVVMASKDGIFIASPRVRWADHLKALAKISSPQK